MSHSEMVDLEREIHLLHLSILRDLAKAEFIAWKIQVVKEASQLK